MFSGSINWDKSSKHFYDTAKKREKNEEINQNAFTILM